MNIRDILRVINDDRNIDVNCLDDVINDHFERKQWIAETLDLNEENEWRFKIGLPSTIESKPLARLIINLIEEITNGEYTIHDLNFMNYRKNKVRITKVINQLWDKFFIDGGPAYSIIYDIFDATRESYPNSDIKKETVLCWYGDYIKNGRIGMISLNPYDYFTLSGHGCSYSSCVAVGGCYDNTILHYLASDCVMPFFVLDDKGKKIGRSLIYLNKWKLCQGRFYGSIFSSDALLIRDYIHEKIGGHWINHKRCIEREDIENDTSAYIDYGYGIVTTRVNDEGYDSTPLMISRGRCLSCGEKTYEEQGLCCAECSEGNETCEWCNERIRGESHCVQEECICDHCYENRAFWCERCGETYHEDYIRCVEGRDVCRYCSEEHSGVCNQCGDSFWFDHLYEVNDNWYCEDCRDEIFTYCNDCNEYHKNEDMVELGNGDFVCERCSEDYCECSVCKKLFCNRDITEEGDKLYCDDCYANIETTERTEDENRTAVNV